MSQENVKLALAVADAWNRGDHEAFLALWDEEAEFYPLRAQLEGKSYRGHDGLERFVVEGCRGACGTSCASRWRG